MAKKTQAVPVPAQAPYTPRKEDFVFLPPRDIVTDTNFASQNYWKGVFIHFFKNFFGCRKILVQILPHSTCLGSLPWK